MSDESTTQIRTEGQPAFPVEDNGNDNHSDSSSDNTNGDQSPSGGEGDQNNPDKKGADAGFADHPRWKQREQDWTNRFNDQEKRHTDELAKFREEMDAKFAAGNKPAANGPVKIPGWFGGNEEQWAEYQADQKRVLDEATASVRSQLTQAEQEQQKRVDDATSFFEEEIKALESDKDLNPQGEKIEREKLLKCALDNDLIDSKGRWNYRAAYRILRGSRPTKPDTTDRKNVAASTTSDNRGESKPSGMATSETFRKNPSRRPW